MPPIIHLAVAQRGLVVQSDSGDMCRRIVALLQDYPEGLTPAGTGSVSCNSVFVLHLCRFLNQEDLMEREAMVQNP